MIHASLPIWSNLQDDDITITFSLASGVDFNYADTIPDGNLFYLHAIFGGKIHFLKAGDASGVIHGFVPAKDTLIFKPFYGGNYFPSRLLANICKPLPSFITYEGVDLATVSPELRNAIKEMWPSLSDPDLDEIINDFESSERPIFVRPGAKVGKPQEIDGKRSFVLKLWKSNPKSTEESEIIFGEHDQELFYKRRGIRYPHIYLHQLRYIEESIYSNHPLFHQLHYGIKRGVGEIGESQYVFNDPEDVELVKQRFYDLGFIWNVRDETATTNAGKSAERATRPITEPVEVNAIANTKFVKSIKLFQAIINAKRKYTQSSRTYCSGFPRPRGADGKFPDGELARATIPDEVNYWRSWLWAGNAPQWLKMPSDLSNGYANELQDSGVSKYHDYGTSYAVQAVKEVAIELNKWWANQDYNFRYTERDWTPAIRTTHLSLFGGGQTNSHAGHQTGLDIDFRLLNKKIINEGPDATDQPAGGGKPWHKFNSNEPRDNYDREAVRKIIELFAERDDYRKAYFNDISINQHAGDNAVELVTEQSGHEDHVHIEICSPMEPTPYIDFSEIDDTGEDPSE